MTFFKFPLFALSLLWSGVASAGGYRGMEGDIYIRIADPNRVAMDQDKWGAAQLAVGLGWDLSDRVCNGAADKIRAALNNTSKPAKYVPSVVTCEKVTDDGTAVWELWDRYAAGRVYYFAPGTAYVVRIHVTDYNAPAIAAASAAKVKLGRALGVSVNGRVNEAVLIGLWEEMSEQGVDFYSYIEP